MNAFAQLAKLNGSEINTSVGFAKINVREKLIFCSSRKLINNKIFRISRYFVYELFRDTGFAFGLTNLKCQKIIYVEF